MGAWLAILLPEMDRASRRELIASRRVRVDGESIDHAKTELAAGARLEADDLPGAWLPPLDERASDRWFAWVDEPACFAGELVLEDGVGIALEVVDRVDGLARVELSGAPVSANAVGAALCEAGMPVVGDLLRGGLAVVGGALLAPTRGA